MAKTLPASSVWFFLFLGALVSSAPGAASHANSGFPKPALDAPMSAAHGRENYARHHPDNPYIVINDMSKLAALRKQFPQLYRDY